MWCKLCGDRKAIRGECINDSINRIKRTNAETVAKEKQFIEIAKCYIGHRPCIECIKTFVSSYRANKRRGNKEYNIDKAILRKITLVYYSKYYTEEDKKRIKNHIQKYSEERKKYSKKWFGKNKDRVKEYRQSAKAKDMKRIADRKYYQKIKEQR